MTTDFDFSNTASNLKMGDPVVLATLSPPTRRTARRGLLTDRRRSAQASGQPPWQRRTNVWRKVTSPILR
jgi:hypothetical protein